MKHVLLAMFVFVTLSPAVAFAGHTAGHGCTGPSDASPGCPADAGSNTGASVPVDNSAFGSGAPTPTQNVGGNTGSQGLSYELESPLAGAGIGSLEQLLTAILNILMIISVPIIVFFVIFAGFNYVTAQGNQEKIKTATRSLTYAVIGAVLILGAVALSEIIAGVVSSFSN